MGHPGLVYRDGFSYAYAAFYTITIPLTGVFFLKRQWMLGKHFGYVTPGEMLADYFRGDAIRFLTVFIALLFSIPYVGIQFGASGYLFEVLTDNLINQNLGMWLMALIMLTYLVTGGLRAVAYVDALQCALMIVGIVITGVIALDAVGGWSALTAGMSHMATMPGVETTKGLGGGDYPSYFAIPGVIQYTAGLGKEAPVGGLWTGVMILTYMFAMMGIQASPAFSMWAFSNNNPRPFAPQQVWVSSFGVGLILLFFTMVQGVGAHLLGADSMASRDPHVLAEILRSPDTEILPAPKEPAKLMALYDAGAIALVGPKIGKDMALADLEAAIHAGAEAGQAADGCRVGQIFPIVSVGREVIRVLHVAPVGDQLLGAPDMPARPAAVKRFLLLLEISFFPVFAQRVPGEAFPHQDAAQVRVPFEADAHQVPRFALLKIRAGPHADQRGQGGDLARGLRFERQRRGRPLSGRGDRLISRWSPLPR